MRGERRGHTVEATGLVHEAWVRLAHSQNSHALSEGEFLGLASQAMRRVLTDHARRRSSRKRGGSSRRTTLSGKHPVWEPDLLTLDLDQLLERMHTLDPELVRIVELRFYAGLSTEEIARAVGMSERTIKRRWRFARAWLQSQLGQSNA